MTVEPPASVRAAIRRRTQRAEHLVRRFFGRFHSQPLDAAELGWVAERLSGPEFGLWQRQDLPDQRHTLTVAQLVTDGPDRQAELPAWVPAAALLHDIGKIQADLGVGGRVLASFVAGVGVRRTPGALGRYLRYPELGADLLRAAGSHPMVVAWAAEHHLDPARWSVPDRWAIELLDADDAAV